METEVTTAEATTTEPVEAAQAILEPDLKSLLAQKEQELEAAKREAKSHQEYGRKTKEELDRQRGLDTKVTDLTTKVQIVTEMLADLIDRDVQAETSETTEEPKPRRKSQEFLNRIPTPEKQAFLRQAEEADGLLKSIGLTMDKSPETKDAYLFFRVGDGERGLEEVKKIVNQKNVEKETQNKETEAQRVERLAGEKATELLRKELEKRGLLVSETSTSGGAIDNSDKAFMEKWGSGDLPNTKENRERAKKLLES